MYVRMSWLSTISLQLFAKVHLLHKNLVDTSKQLIPTFCCETYFVAKLQFHIGFLHIL